MVLETFILLIDWIKLIDWFANTMRCIKSTLCSTRCDRVEFDGLLIADTYKYTWISNKVYKDLSATLLLSVSVSNPGYSVLSHREYTGIWVIDRIQDLQATLYIGVSVSNPGYSGLSPKVYTGISVGDLSATLHPKVSVCNLGYSSLSPGPECRSATKYNKICKLHCTKLKPPVTWGIYPNTGQRQSIRIPVSYTATQYISL